MAKIEPAAMNGDFSSGTLGRVVKSLDFGGFVFTQSVYSPSTVLPPHAHKFATISLVRRGSFVEVLGRRPQQCSPFSLVVEPPGGIHSDQFGPTGAVCFHITLKPQQLDAIRHFSRIFDDAPNVRGGSLPVVTMRIDHELRLMDDAAVLTIEGLVFELLAEAVRSTRKDSGTRSPGWVRQARDMIHADFAEKLSLQRIADCVGVHPAHLASTFRKHYGCTVGDYVRKIRIETAIQLMQSDRSLAEVASSVGFYDQSHFTHAFSRHTGMTPARFQAQLQADKAYTKILHSSNIS
jgi:AraC family transcriptional regulator